MLSWIDLTIVIAFLGITLFLGLRNHAHAKDNSRYLLGGRALTLPAFIATTVSTWYGGILGIGEYTWLYGISNWIVFGVPYYLGALLFAIFMSRRARSSESLTIPHRFETSYGHGNAFCAAILIFLTTIPGAYILMMGTLGSISFNISSSAGIILTAVFVVCYLWRGGFSSVVRTDAIQCALMFGGFIMLSGWLLVNYGLEPLASLPKTHLEPTGGQSIGSILIWYIIALSTLAEPNFFQRAFAAKTPQIARKGLFISILCWIVFDLMTTFCGLYTRALLPNLDNPVQAFPQLAAAVLPVGLIGIFYAGLFATILSSLDSNLFTSAATFGRDLLPQNHTSKSDCSQKIKIGIVLSAILASIIAMSAGSVVKIWKIFGSVSAASLLIPIIGTYYRPFKMSSTGCLILMINSSCATIAWFIIGKINGAYWMNIEPLLIGGGVALCCFAIDKFVKKNN
ncbi:MAG: sodium:solute symporter family protein [Proteobacteria bacterium]|nr:sodium:solute symporter family protein [Pseudomonadota bacterium]